MIVSDIKYCVNQVIIMHLKLFMVFRFALNFHNFFLLLREKNLLQSQFVKNNYFLCVLVTRIY